MLATNAKGEKTPPYLIFCGENTSCVPEEAMKDGGWWEFQANGWMHTDQFKLWMKKFIEYTNKKKEEMNERKECTLLLVDGHNSRLSP